MVRRPATFQYVIIPQDTKINTTKEGFLLERHKEKIKFREIINLLKSVTTLKEDTETEEINRFDKGSAYIIKKDEFKFEILIDNGRIDSDKNLANSISIRPIFENFNKYSYLTMLEVIKDVILNLNLKLFSVDELKIIKPADLEDKIKKLEKNQNE